MHFAHSKTGPDPITASRQDTVRANVGPLPRGPVFGWLSLRGRHDDGVPNVGQLAHGVLTTSGRAAIFHALKLLQLSPRRGVLLPTYHCPTMVAPALLAGLQPVFYALGEDGLPDIAALERGPYAQAGAMLVPHLFGRTQSLAAVRRWCDAHGIALIEDCAHALFGQAGERPVGAWGNFATASLSKFLPVPEGGLLASATRPMPALLLRPRHWRDEIKGWVDVAEAGAQHRRLLGLNGVLGSAFRAKHALRGTQWPCLPSPIVEASRATNAEQMMSDCDMARVNDIPLAVTRWMRKHLPLDHVVTRRRVNFGTYARCLDGVRGARLLPGADGAGWPEAVAPYVFPLWVDNVDTVYARVRQLRLPVFRWDRLWPGTPQLPGDVGMRWSHHVLQLLCHQDLSRADVEHVSHNIRQLLAGH
ncbi:MAG TPA: DegT/DnrJ/EryC1/StrS family aminotransferase [Rubrivivax sp.]|nr:DegT/DnrJ/EryC1/StrS family aminotransferase [Rubrivivax sp.]